MVKIKSYSHVWEIDGVLYNFNDIKLPFPVTYTYMKWLGVCAVVVWIFNKVPPISLIDNAFIKLGLPFLLAHLMSKKRFEGKTALQYLATQVTFLLRPKVTFMGHTVKGRCKHKIRSDITLVRKETVRHAPDKVH